MPLLPLLAFLAKVLGISLSGVMAPGPVTAVTLGLGARNRHAGALVAVGHGIVEFPLMLLVLGWLGRALQRPAVQVGIGLAGGVMLLVMGAGMLRGMRKVQELKAVPTSRGPVVVGIVLTAGNPYFLAWWAAVGLGLALKARELGLVAFALFALVHWLCDLAWLECLSLSSHKGTKLLGERVQRVILGVCGAALVGFGLWFLIDAAAGIAAWAGAAPLPAGPRT